MKQQKQKKNIGSRLPPVRPGRKRRPLQTQLQGRDKLCPYENNNNKQQQRYNYNVRPRRAGWDLSMKALRCSRRPYVSDGRAAAANVD